MTTQKTYILVPYSEKDKAKALGAKWDHKARKWYFLGVPPEHPGDWADKPITFEGEDRDFGGELCVDPAPKGSRFRAAACVLREQDWVRLRSHVISRAGKCEICGLVPASKDPALRVRERWSYDKNTLVQKLVRFIAVCQDCYDATLYGFGRTTTRPDRTKWWLGKFRNESPEEVQKHISTAIETWQWRGKIKWKTDFSLLTENGFSVESPDTGCKTGDRGPLP